MPKIERMRENARKELAKRENDDSSTNIEEEKEPPSMVSGMFLIFAGSITLVFFWSAGNGLLGLLASAGFIVIGMGRVFRATKDKSKPHPKTLKDA